MAISTYLSDSLGASGSHARARVAPWARLQTWLRLRASDRSKSSPAVRVRRLPMPQRFADSYRWADGTWTQFG